MGNASVAQPAIPAQAGILDFMLAEDSRIRENDD
jgi:hypothetical protein